MSVNTAQILALIPDCPDNAGVQDLKAAIEKLATQVNDSIPTITSGSYTPSITSSSPPTFDAVTPFVTNWFRVNNDVTVYGRVNADPTSDNQNSFIMSLPIASTLAPGDVGGNWSGASPVDFSGSILVSGNQAIFRVITAATTNTACSFHFTYRVI